MNFGGGLRKGEAGSKSCLERMDGKIYLSGKERMMKQRKGRTGDPSEEEEKMKLSKEKENYGAK